MTEVQKWASTNNMNFKKEVNWIRCVDHCLNLAVSGKEQSLISICYRSGEFSNKSAE